MTTKSSIEKKISQIKNEMIRNTFISLLEEEFQKYIVDIPIYDCLKYSQTWFIKNVVENRLFFMKAYEVYLQHGHATDSTIRFEKRRSICKICCKALQLDQIPKNLLPYQIG